MQHEKERYVLFWETMREHREFGSHGLNVSLGFIFQTGIRVFNLQLSLLIFVYINGDYYTFQFTNERIEHIKVS